MNVDVVLYAGAVTPDRVSAKDVAVIDVLRATSVIVEALNNGAKSIIPVVTVGEAEELADKYGRSNVILAGERNAVLIQGFDKDNSPLAYGKNDVEGRTIILTTTNGTRAIRLSRFAHNIYIAAFINMGATSRILASGGRDVVLVCAGREDRFTAEDGLCAGAMVDVLVRKYGYKATDIAEVLQHMYNSAKENLRGRLSTTYHYNYIMGLGYDADIEFCLQRDIYDIVPRYTNKGEITI